MAAYKSAKILLISIFYKKKSLLKFNYLSVKEINAWGRKSTISLAIKEENPFFSAAKSPAKPCK